MELKKFWVKNYKSLHDVVLEFPVKRTLVIGPSGSGKTALAETFEILRGARPRQATVGIEIVHNGCHVAYEVEGDKEFMLTDCGADEADRIVREFLSKVVVIKNIDWKAVRSLQPVAETTALQPDASNAVQYLYALTGGTIPEPLIAALRYVFPVKDMWFVDDGGVLLLKLVAENGMTLTQATMPSGVLKTLIIETALMANPTMLIIDDFECCLDPETQQFIMDEVRSHGVYAILTTHSAVAVDYAKTPKEVVMLYLAEGKTKAWRFGEEVEERLRDSRLTLSELIGSGLLEPPSF